jgi:hypothetical protein
MMEVWTSAGIRCSKHEPDRAFFFATESFSVLVTLERGINGRH